MVELLMTAFIMSIGLLGLALLQSMAIHSYGNTRSQITAVTVGQNILESVDAEARQQRLIRTISGTAAPALSAYYTASPVTRAYNVYGTFVNTGSSDPLERVGVINATTTSSLDATGASAAAGSVYTFVVTVQYTDTVTGAGTVTRSMVFRRKVTL